MLARIIVLPFGSIWRLKQYCLQLRFNLLRRLCIFLYQVYQAENGSSIAWCSEFEGVPCLPHGMKGIFISGGAKIGKNCVIYQQVTIGSNTLPDSQTIGTPKIGDNCYIGAGAKIVGNVTIGNNVRIGANTVVYKDVPENSVVVSWGQRCITKDHLLDNRFYSFHGKFGKWVYYDNGDWIPVENDEILHKLNKV
jgi:serine O-acetyltransferase